LACFVPRGERDIFPRTSSPELRDRMGDELGDRACTD